MTDSCDYPDDMRDRRDIDEAFEAVLAGRATSEGSTEFADFVEAVRHSAVSVQPEPDEALRQLFAEGLEVPAAAAAPVVASSHRRDVLRRVWKPFAARLAGASLVAKVMLGSAVAVAGVTGGAATGSLPGPVQDAVADVVSSVSDIQLPSSADSAAFGQDVAEDATDPEEPGVDGSEVAEKAPGNDARVDGPDHAETVREVEPAQRAEVQPAPRHPDRENKSASVASDVADQTGDPDDASPVTTPVNDDDDAEPPHGSSETGEEHRSTNGNGDAP